MLYKEIKRHTLEKISQETLGGAVIEPSYNNQADYELRIPGFINSAIMQIGTTARRKLVLYIPQDGTNTAGAVRYEMPKDFYHFKSGAVYVIHDGSMSAVSTFKVVNGKSILVPKELAGKVAVEYYAYPAQLPERPADDYELDAEPEIIAAAEIYAAAHLISQENEFLYASLMNEYSERKQEISQGIIAEAIPIADMYGDGGDFW